MVTTLSETVHGELWRSGMMPGRDPEQVRKLASRVAGAVVAWLRSDDARDDMAAIVDDALGRDIVALMSAARVLVDNGRQGPTCCYGRKPHPLGTPGCALCDLHNALATLDARR